MVKVQKRRIYLEEEGRSQTQNLMTLVKHQSNEDLDQERKEKPEELKHKEGACSSDCSNSSTHDRKRGTERPVDLELDNCETLTPHTHERGEQKSWKYYYRRNSKNVSKFGYLRRVFRTLILHITDFRGARDLNRIIYTRIRTDRMRAEQKLPPKPQSNIFKERR